MKSKKFNDTLTVICKKEIKNELTVNREYNVLGIAIRCGLPYYKVINDLNKEVHYEASNFEDIILIFSEMSRVKYNSDNRINKVVFGDMKSKSNMYIRENGNKSIITFNDTPCSVILIKEDGYFTLSIKVYDSVNKETVTSSDIEIPYNDKDLFDRFFEDRNQFSWKCDEHKEFTNTSYDLNTKAILNEIKPHKKEIWNLANSK